MKERKQDTRIGRKARRSSVQKASPENKSKKRHRRSPKKTNSGRRLQPQAASRSPKSDKRSKRRSSVAKERSKSRKGSQSRHKRTRRVDRKRRRMKLPTRHGFEPITVRGSRLASLLGRYTSAVGHFLQTGDVDRLQEFEGRKLNKHPLITDPEILTELAEAGELQLDELYVHPGGSSHDER